MKLSVFLSSNKIKTILLLCIYILSNVLLIDNLPFGDDFIFVFGESEIKSAPNPFYFFFPWSDYFKSWGLSYFVFWNLYKIFGENFVYYRLVNILLHFVNAIMFKKFLQVSQTPKMVNKYITLIFLFCPLSILTTSWIFQLKTLISTFFILLFLIKINEAKTITKNKIIKAYVIYVLSLLSKISGILLPFIFIGMWNRLSLNRFKKCITLVIFMGTALIFGLINIKGITHLVQETKHINKKSAEVIIESSVTRSETRIIKNKDVDQQKTINHDIDLSKEVLDSSKRYFSQSYNFFDKYVITIQNFGRLIVMSMGVNDYFPFYENNLKTFTSSKLIIYSLVGVLSVLFIFYTDKKALLLISILFIPVSGMFYIPYMKFSYTSDHWFYLPAIGIFLFLSKNIKNIYFHQVLLGITLCQFIWVQYKYTNYEKLLIKNSKSYDNRIITEHKIRYDLLKGNVNFALKSYIELNTIYQNKSIDYLSQIINLAQKTNNQSVLDKYYLIGAKQYLESSDLKAIQAYNLNFLYSKHKDILPLVESLNTTFSKKINEETYKLVLDKLR